MHQNILFLSERDFLTLPVIRSLDRKAYGIFIVGPKASLSRFSRFCTQFFPYPPYTKANKDHIISEYINSVSMEQQIDIVIPLDLGSTLWVAKNKHRLKMPLLPVSDPDVLLRLHNKWELTKALDWLSIAYPKTGLVENEELLVPSSIEYPFLLKPLDQDSGKGIVKMDGPTDFQEYVAKQPVDGAPSMLFQSFIEGSDIDMSLLAIDGKIMTWTIQKWIRPGLLGFVADQGIYAIGEKLVAKEMYSGFLHIDLRIDRRTGEVYVLECNPRAWGTMNASILAGANFIADAVCCVNHEAIINQTISKESYATFHEMFMSLVMRPWKFLSMSPMSRRDFLSVLTDPIPYIALSWNLWRKK